ncbi:MAG TPA: hypothetical protein PKI93_01650 [Alphaproteobacteria bacterium]|nr:hypothetical protein [Alphaproteobacteria bacterium]HNS44546.1 hypothetical protein [Alphaproteobacteria bacterium]
MNRVRKLLPFLFVAVASGCGRGVSDLSEAQDYKMIVPRPPVFQPSDQFATPDNQDSKSFIDREFQRFIEISEEIDGLYDRFAVQSVEKPSVEKCLEVNRIERGDSLRALFASFSAQGRRMIELGLMDPEAVRGVILTGAESLLTVKPIVEDLGVVCSLAYPRLMSRKLTAV